MDAGKLDQKFTLKAYSGAAWAAVYPVWAQITHVDRVAFSPIAKARPGIKLILRADANITLGSMLERDGKTYLAATLHTALDYYEMTAADVTIESLILATPSYTVDQTYHRQVKTGEQREAFCGVFAEKYINWSQVDPYAQIETGLVLITPKAVSIVPGAIIERGGEKLLVRTCHTLEPYQNGYDVTRLEDV